MLVSAITLVPGCATQPQRTYYVLPEAAGDNNRIAEHANVFVHLSNQGMSDHLKFFFEIKQASSDDIFGERVQGSGWGIIGFGPHTYWSYGYAIPPGHYVLVFDDHIGQEWHHAFVVDERPMHLDLTYWLREDREAFESRGERLYRADLKVRESDQEPVVF
ncbi:MAG: hypothetical protein ACE37H_10300 [Phycisphaeraceae bacterium]